MLLADRALAPEIDQLRRQFEQIAVDADALVTPLREDQFGWRRASNSWSIGESLDHLNAAAKMYLPKLDEGIAEGICNGAYSEGPFRYGWVDRLVVHVSEPPSRVRVRSPQAFLPAPGASRHEVLSALHAYQRQFVDRLHQANGLDLSRTCVRSPVSKWLRFSLGAGFALIAAHERRHLWQARKIAEMPQFPR